MYLPYLRGRQYELIALRELVEKDLIGDKIIPIVEPIKLTATFVKTLNAFDKKRKNIIVIHNPKVGDFNDKIDKNSYFDEFKKLLASKYINIGHLVNENSIEELEELGELSKKKINLLNTKEEYLEKYLEIDGDDKFEIEYIVMNDLREFRRSVEGEKILLADHFNKKARNSDYENKEELYTKDHLYYRGEGYIGISDYSIIGKEFLEGGFAPYAVAIHIVYFDENKVLKIRHFISKSNEDIRNPAKKFYEAIEVLYHCKEIKTVKSYGLEQLRGYYESENYPGLGVVKKLSVMHHIEILSKYMDGETGK